jgi:hypothetical protein
VRPVSAEFQAAVKGTHVAETRVEAWYNGVRIATTERDNRLPGLVEGTVTVDATSSVRRTYAASFATPTSFPGSADYSGPFSAYGTQHKVWRGVVFADGRREWVQLGVFRIDSPGVPIESGALKVSGSDLSKQLQDMRFRSGVRSVTSFTVPASIAVLVRSALGDTWPVRNLTGNASLTPAMVWDRERWDAIRDLALSIGAEVVVGVDGTVLIQNVPKVTDTVRWTVNYNEIVITGTQELDRSQTYNSVTATGERSDNVPPAIGRAEDLTPSSPTYVLGPFGRVPVFYSSPSLTTNLACQRAAETILGRVRAMTRRVTFDCIPNPAVDVGDVMRINLPDGTSAVYIIDSIQVPLAVDGLMRVTTRTNNDQGLS